MIFVVSHFLSHKVSPEWRLNPGFRTKKNCPFFLNRGVLLIEVTNIMWTFFQDQNKFCLRNGGAIPCTVVSQRRGSTAYHKNKLIMCWSNNLNLEPEHNFMLQFSLVGLLHTHCRSFPKTKIFLLYTVSGLGCTIVGLPQFEQRCPLQVPVLWHTSKLCFKKKKKQGNVIFPHAKSEGRFYRSTCLIESPSLNVCECKVVSKQRRLSAFFGQQHKEETAETSMASKLPKWNFQQSWLEKYKWLKFDPPKGMLCLLCQKSKKQNPFTIGCANYRTSTLVHNTRYTRIKKYKVKK